MTAPRLPRYTERLVLRALRPGDEADVVAYRRRADVYRYMPSNPLGMHRAWAQIDPRNVASARVCERLGMRQEAHLHHDIWFKGEWGDTAIYAILATEWHGRK